MRCFRIISSCAQESCPYCVHRGTVPLCTHLEEHPALQFHEAVVGHRIREVTLEVDADEVQVVVLEIVECAEMEHNQNRPAG